MRIVQKIGLYQLLIISGSDLILQKLVGVQRFQMHKRLHIIEQPAVQALDSVEQSLRELSEIRLPETELRAVDSGQQCVFINSVCHLCLQRLTDHLQKLLLLLRIRIFCNHGKYRLQRAVIIAAADIHADSRIDQRLLKRRSRRGKQRIVQDVKRLI